jgi:hypothetical protein
MAIAGTVRPVSCRFDRPDRGADQVSPAAGVVSFDHRLVVLVVLVLPVTFALVMIDYTVTG